MKKKRHREYYGGKIKGLVERVAQIVARDDQHTKGKIAYDVRNGEYGILHSMLSGMIEGYGKRENCFNCTRSMEIDLYTADVLDARLLLLTAQKVRDSMEDGADFHDANLVRVQDLDTTLSVKCRTTQCKYLGLMRQPEDQRNKGKWFITAWGWKVLRGERVPKRARYWDGKFLDRSEETTNLTEMMQEHLDGSTYSPADWTDFGGYIQDEPQPA